ncbi:MAG: glycosyltransferase family 2 protein [Planctomycetota bacterium]
MIAGVWAVIVNWNGGSQNLDCLRSLVGQGIDPARIVLIDNASTDGSPAAVAAEFPAVTLLRNAENQGYGHGTNRGIRHALAAGAETVFLVNNDLTLASGALAALFAALAAAPGAGIVGPRIVLRRDPGTIWCAGGLVTWRQNLSTMIGHGRSDGPVYRATREVDYVPGCAMLVRRAVFERVGLLDGDYFAYHEDVELCVKAKEAGFAVLVAGAALAHHDAHHSTGGGYNPRRKYMMGANTVWFLKKHGTPLRWLSFLLFDVFSLPFVLLRRAPRGEGAAVLAKARGMLDAARGRRVTEESLRGWTNGSRGEG